jgi:hypothetical protein
MRISKLQGDDAPACVRYFILSPGWLQLYGRKSTIFASSMLHNFSSLAFLCLDCHQRRLSVYLVSVLVVRFSFQFGGCAFCSLRCLFPSLYLL